MTEEIVQLDSWLDSGYAEVDLELRLLDSEWIDAEFSAIMTSSGFGDRIVAATGPRPLATARPVEPTVSGGRRQVVRRRISSRVRSPPS